MNKLFLITCLVLLVFSSSKNFAQRAENYKWNAVSYLAQNEKYANSDEVYLKRKQIMDFNFDEETKRFEKVMMSHFIVQVNTEKGLKKRKELEPPTESENQQVLEFKARVINSDGSSYEFKESELKEKKESERELFDEDGENVEEEEEDDEVDEEEEDEIYKYYDLSELKIGSQIEFYMILKTQNPNMSGAMLNYQSRIPVQDFSFELNATKEFTFSFKSYNGCPEIIRDSTNKVRGVYTLKDQMIDAFPNEKFSNYGSNVRGFIYKLEGYELGKTKNIFNNEDFSTNLYNFMYTIDKKGKVDRKKGHQIIQSQIGKNRRRKNSCSRKLHQDQLCHLQRDWS